MAVPGAGWGGTEGRGGGATGDRHHPRSPLGKGLLGKFEGDELEIVVAGARQQFAVTEVK
ncbi:Transcription elongation factor [Pseudomonas chlororaphis subsp. aurantiaca]|nr:Transcription elongation factor [Pseudomonas chlororaphis subsp. aurantiaca]